MASMPTIRIDLPPETAAVLDRLATEMKIEPGDLALRAILAGLPVVRGVLVTVRANHARVPAARLLEAHQALTQGMSASAEKLAQAMEAMEAAGTAGG